MKTEHDHLEAMADALDASLLCVERPVCRGFTGDWQITGKLGHILADGHGFLLYVTIDERTATEREPSSRPWKNTKAKLAFCKVTQNGDWEGCLQLDRLPTPTEAELIREALGIRKRRHLSPEQSAINRLRLERVRALHKSPLNGPGSAGS